MLCLLWILLKGLLADYPPFTFDELPFNRVINIWQSTNGQRVYYPIHFGPTGTEAWESVFLTWNGVNDISFGLTDCFCGGDELDITLTNVKVNSPPQVYNLFPQIPSFNCDNYSETFDTCYEDWDNWGSGRFVFGNPENILLNITFSTRYSPYGGDIAYFWIILPAE